MRHPVFACLSQHSSAIILCVLLFILYGLFLAHKIDLTTADLGRHIKNGEMLLENSSVLTQNVYSYTYPASTWVNHHWGSGLLAYAIWKSFGFVGIQIVFIVFSFATLAVFLFLGKSYAGWGITGFITLAVVPLLGERTEVRPEVISYLFSGLFFLLLCRYRESSQGLTFGKAKVSTWGALGLLPFIEVLWVNTHVYFLLGPLILGAFLLESLLIRRAVFLKLLLVFLATVVAMLVNPFGIKAFTAAVTIFENYGYRLAENQPVWFMEKIMPEPNFLIFKILFGLLVLSFIFVIARRRQFLRLSHLFVITGIGLMAWFAIRNLALFGFFLIPVVAANARSILGSRFYDRILQKIAAVFAVGTFFVFATFGVPRHFTYWRVFGFGLERGNSAAIEFLSQHEISGPIFNNYDIGGYLIFHLFPHEKVFVDNRPEAYPVEFFTKEYIPMQEDSAVWKEKLAEYHFNAIVFSHRDATPWGQRFLIERVQDPDWAPVFVDEKVLILIRRTEANRAVIQAFTLPPETFKISVWSMSPNPCLLRNCSAGYERTVRKTQNSKAIPRFPHRILAAHHNFS